jgi:acetoin utilization deacetylase AcuC-like enzyme
MLPFPLIYDDAYDLNFGAHVFPTRKYKLIRQRLLDTYLAGPEDFVPPEPATREDLLLVHTEEWVRKLETGTLSYHDVLQLEAPYSRQMVRAFMIATGGTILAGRKALERGAGFNIGGGFHHAHPGHGEGFCAVHDVAVAIRVLQRDGLIRKALVVDVDVHHGNGTAAIFARDASVFTLSIHQYANYPHVKPPSTIDIHLGDGAGDREYLEKLGGACDVATGGFRPDILFYIAGSDAFYDDQLGGLALTREGMFARDRMVFDCALRRRIPVAVTLAGGYARNLDDTVELHSNTVLALVEAFQENAHVTGGTQAGG